MKLLKNLMWLMATPIILPKFLVMYFIKSHHRKQFELTGDRNHLRKSK